MKALKIVGGVVGGLVAVVLIAGFASPAEYHSERSITIDAPVEIVFEHVQDLEKNQVWSPWVEKDPTIKPTYAQTKVGLGASYTWTSEDSGNGKLTIASLEPNKSIKTDLDFDGTKATGLWDFESSADGKSVKVTWGIEGDSGMNPISRIFGAMIDGMVGPDFERGLANLKKVSEAA